MAAGTVRVRGLREVVTAFKRVSRDTPKIITDELKPAAEPVRRDAAMRISRYRGTTQRLAIRVKGRGSVFVQGTARKRGGKRGDFGRLQQRHLEAALQDNEEQVRAELEKGIDRLIAKNF